MDNLLTIDQVSEKLNVPKKTLYNWVNQRRIPYTKLGALLRFKEKDLENYLDKRLIKQKN